jgi:ribonuclease HI
MAQASAADGDKFVNCDHFTVVNEMLMEMGLTQIDWDPVSRCIVYTDGACSNNGKGLLANAAYSAYFANGPLAGFVKYGKVATAIIDGKTVYGSNQRAEGIGIITAFESIAPGTDITLIIDTNFWKQMIEEYMPAWDRRGVDFKTKKNPDITVKMFDLVTKAKATGAVEIIHVGSHGKDKNALPEHIEGNRVADVYAVKGKQLCNFKQLKCKAGM